MSQCARLKKARSRVKAFLTRTTNTITSNVAPFEAKVKYEKLEDTWKEFNQIQQEIEELCPDDQQEQRIFLEDCDEERKRFEEHYFEVTETLRKIMHQTEQVQPTINIQGSADNSIPEGPDLFQGRRNHPKLPQIKLPEFDGQYTKWLFFRNSFESTIHDDIHLTNVQKHQYLIGVLQGEARKVVEGFTISNENYVNAWNLLKNTYDNHMMIIETHLDELFKFPDIAKENKSDSLRRLNWHIQTNISALKSLNQPVEQWSTIVIHLAKRKLDYTELRDWQEIVKDKTPSNMPTLEEFTKFLAERSQALRIINQNKAKTTNTAPQKDTQKEKKKDKKVVMAATSSGCNLFGEGHPVFQCRELLKLKPDERRRLLVEKKNCLNCLRLGHKVKECKGSRCKKCNQPHNTIIHKDEEVAKDVEKTTSSVNHCTQSSDSSAPLSMNLAKGGKSQVLLSTALVYIKDHQGKEVTCRALLDSGSQSNLISANLSKQLGLKCIRKNLEIYGVDGTRVDAAGVNRIQLSSKHSQFESELECLVLPSITEILPQTRVDIKGMILPQNIELADPTFNEPGTIDLLIGAGTYWEIIIGHPRNRTKGQPALQNTKLGWILGGEIPIQTNCSMPTCLAVTNKDLSQQLEKFWKQEAIPETQHYTKEEILCEEQFSNKITTDSTGRFIVRLPIRPEIILGESLAQARRRFESLETRFKKQPTLKLAYYSFMDEYIRLGHMSLIDDSQVVENENTYYILHHAVLRAESATTKLRVVFDASAKTSRGTSLNDKLIAGPNLQGELLHLVLRFRTYKFVITADLEKMFRQIWVHPDDRSLQQILWRKDTDSPIRVYQLNTVTYGTASAPYHAIRCLRELADRYEHQYPLEANAIRKDFYMDDCISGGDNLSTVIQLQQQLLELFSKGQMLLRMWRSNDKRILQNISNHQNTQELMILDKEETCKTLGLVWNSALDLLQYKVVLSPNAGNTKREVLSKISQIFDPLGLLAPALIIGKIIMQQLWISGLDWDQPLTSELQTSWEEYYTSLPQLNQLRIPRNINPQDDGTGFQIFGFSDASEKAIGACLYAVSTSHKGTITSHLICSKSKVAPIKNISLPRLELEAALLLATLMQEMNKAMDNKVKGIYLWSDSTIVLGWI